MIKFRPLRADEIECRPQVVTPKGFSLLLYKNARCDMNVLDEVVGAENWQREHREYKGNLFCRVGINVNHDKKDAEPRWVWKEDCGTESNQDKEKGEASDSFKRAGFNWGIGRELYTAPFIWVSGHVTQKEGSKNYIPDCKNDQIMITKFTVIDGEHAKTIDAIEIVIKGEVVFSWSTKGGTKKVAKPEDKGEQAPTEAKAEKLLETKHEEKKDGAKKMSLNDALNCTTVKGKRFGDLSVEQLNYIIENSKDAQRVTAAKIILGDFELEMDENSISDDDEGLPWS